jgi:hypothetical protein
LNRQRPLLLLLPPRAFAQALQQQQQCLRQQWH